jgi:V-type H+-transporting ATPase subunit C
VPLSNTKDFFKSYETLCDMVVPRSAYFITKDSEYELYSVTVFKKYGAEFVHKAREKKWVPRDYKYEENGSQKEMKELEKAQADEKRQWGETLRLGRTGWSEGVVVLVHVVVLRVFIETVLRYGLPLDFVAGLVKVSYKALFGSVDRANTPQDNRQAREASTTRS